MKISSLKKYLSHIDWTLVLVLIPILCAGLVTMSSFVGESSFFWRQFIFIIIGFVFFFIFSNSDIRFLKKSRLLFGLFIFFLGILITLFVVGYTSNGAKSWFNFGFFSFQPVDMVKVIVVLMLAKYFSRRHVEIAQTRHLLISGLYAFIPFILVFLQPDFGSAMIILLVWFGMALISGLGRKQLLILSSIGLIAFMSLWFFVFKPYQKARIINFVNPTSDIKGTGYNAYQSTIAVGSGKLIGKGVGFGTQSRLEFLPEYQTDFIFAAYSEEWGFLGSLIILILYCILIWRIIKTALIGATNFEMLYGVGIAILFFSHAMINIGMNIGVLPVTGIPLPFMSYGGSHIVTELAALGLLMSTRKYSRATHRDRMKNEFLGIA